MKIFGYDIKLSKRVPIYSRSYGNVVRMLGQDQREYIKEGYKLNANIYAVINKITRSAALARWKLFDVTGEKEEIDRHPVLDLLKRPNPLQGTGEFIENFLGFKLITGESFLTGISPDNGENAGQFQELWVMPPPITSIKTDPYGIPEVFDFSMNGLHTLVEPEAVLWIKYWNPTAEDNRGMSPIEAGRRVVTQSNDTYLASSKMLQNSGAQGILSLDDEDTTWSPEQAEAVEQKYYEKYGGPAAMGRIIVTGSKMNWQQIGLKATDLELALSQKATLRDICNLYGAASMLFNDPDNKTFANMKEARKDLIANVVLTEMQSITDEYNRWMLPPFERKDNRKLLLELDKSVWPELSEDEERLANVANSSWWWTPNQKLEYQGMEQSENPLMDEVYLPTSLIPLNDEPMDLAKAYERHSQGK